VGKTLKCLKGLIDLDDRLPPSRFKRMQLWPYNADVEPPSHPFSPDDYGIDLIEIELLLGQAPAVSTAKQFLSSLERLAAPLSFEIIVSPKSRTIQFVCSESDFLRVHTHLWQCWPDLAVRRGASVLRESWESHGGEAAILDFGLVRECTVPLEVFENLETDPLATLIAALPDLSEGDLALIQVLFQPVHIAWGRGLLQAAEWLDAHAHSMETLELVSTATRKASQPLFASVIRTAALSAVPKKAWEIVHALAAFLKRYSTPPNNALFPLSDGDYAQHDHKMDMLSRRSRRSGVLLNLSELFSLVHFPLVENARVNRDQSVVPQPLPPWKPGAFGDTGLM
jgi:hypothetical protein